MSQRDVQFVAQSVLDEHSGNYRTAFYDLAARFVAVVHGTSPGFLRWAPDDPQEPVNHDVPNPVCDTWISTGRET